MRLEAVLLAILYFISLVPAALVGRGHWPNQLYPRVRFHRYSGCRHNTTNYAHLERRNVQIRRCISFDKALHEARASRQKFLEQLQNQPVVTEEDIDRANHPEDYLMEAVYWQFPGQNREHLLMPMERCNITIFSELGCKSNTRLVKFTNEASDVCINAHRGRSLWVDCYSKQDLANLEKEGLGPPEQWKTSGILRYGDTNATSFQQEFLAPAPEKDLNKTYDPQSEVWQRTCQGRRDTHSGIFRDKIHECSTDPVNGCHDDHVGSIWLGDFPFAEKC